MIYGTTIGKRYSNCTFDNFDDVGSYIAVNACKKVTSGESSGVILLGPVGSGKTHLLVSLVHAIDKDNKFITKQGEDENDTVVVTQRANHIEFWTILDLVHALRGEISSGAHTISQRCCDANLLVIDDFGTTRATDYVIEEIFRILDYRYRDEKPIAIAAEITNDGKGGLDEIAARYGDRVVSRWIQSCDIAIMKGSDYRTK